MENIPVTFRIFPWQFQAMQNFEKRNKSNLSFEMRNAISKYIEKSLNKTLSRDQLDILHSKARMIFEKNKRTLNKRGKVNVKRNRRKVQK